MTREDRHRSRYANRSAATTPAFAALTAQWEMLAVSRRFRQRLAEWADPVLGYQDGEALMADALRGCEQQRRSILEALGARAPHDELAMIATLRALVPRLVFLVNRSHPTGLDLDERSATVLAIASEVVLACRPDTARSWYDRRLWSNISKRYNRWVARQLRQLEDSCQWFGIPPDGSWEGPHFEAGDVAARARLTAALAIHPDPAGDGDFQLAELANWVAEHARVDIETARLVVLTRLGGLSVEAAVDANGVAPDSLRRRRHRAEQRLLAAVAA